ncbi:MAG TPA: hypothetical protein VJ858_04780 [Acidimicrobiia bacterium]|nr:hypothetical protein [Acidimicrobiia bacterium]
MSRLETVLMTLPDAVEWPKTSEHLATRVSARIEAGEPTGRRRLSWVLAAIAIVVLVIGLVPDTRRAVGDLFREAGVRIGFIAETPSIDPGSLHLGDAIELEDVFDRLGFEPLVPAELGPPDAVFLGTDLHVSMVWEEEVVIVTQTAANGDYAQKGVTPDTDITAVEVDGRHALWLEGAQHTFTLLDPDGVPMDETTRLAHNVLLWSVDGMDFRLELTEDLDRALEIAESMEER